jgi:hypothetical protein
VRFLREYGSESPAVERGCNHRAGDDDDPAEADHDHSGDRSADTCTDGSSTNSTARDRSSADNAAAASSAATADDSVSTGRRYCTL